MISYPTTIQVFSARDGGLILQFSSKEKNESHEFFVSNRSAKGLLDGIFSHFGIDLDTCPSITELNRRIENATRG